MRVDDAEEKAKMRKTLAEEQLPEKFKLLEAMMDATYCCGDSLTLADFYVYGLLNWIGMNTLDGVPHHHNLRVQEAYQISRDPEQPPEAIDVTAKIWKLPWKKKAALVRTGELVRKDAAALVRLSSVI